MIEKLEIKGFKCFRHFEIDGLRRINLIAGKNSVGKSALLEAIRLYANPDAYALLDTLAWRDEIQPQSATWQAEDLNGLFWRTAAGSINEIEILGAHKVRVKLGWARWKPDAGDWDRVNEPEPPRIPDPNMIRGLWLSIDVKGLNSKNFIRIDELSPLRPPPHGSWSFEGAAMRHAKSDPPLHYLPSGGLSSASMCQLFEQIVATEAEDRVNMMLKWLVPDAERLLTKGTGNQRNLFLKRQGASAPEPLKRFGDGAARLTALGLALINARNGFCLIDEIENGVHFELFDSVWGHLSRVAREFNVQIFVTSHSKDCLEAFGRSFDGGEFDACYYRLERHGEDIKPVRLDDASFFSIVRGSQFEVR